MTRAASLSQRDSLTIFASLALIGDGAKIKYCLSSRLLFSNENKIHVCNDYAFRNNTNRRPDR